eukprot:TRINITY_DN11900_c0_g1_i1.p1 TRINITY_DN11900_c0_g1~~TRINITY_DN11900_c0_g1_i1.p1  ORF type:complete len:115 (-),score=25.42 TRINITY_DN11900_c0_g1_i1:50-394(-)
MDDLKVQNERSCEALAEIIRQHGKPNPNYPNDIDLDYGTLRVNAEDKIGGIMALLKSMKQRKIVDFVGPMLHDDSTVTLINDYYQEFKTQLIRYDEIKDKVKGEITGHQKVGGW